MSIFAIIVMWVWTAAAYLIISRWNLGTESDRRQTYWSRYEDK